MALSVCLFPGDIFVIIGCLLCYLYWYQTRLFKYWRNHGVPYIEPGLFFGSITDAILKRETWFELFHKCYKSFKEHGFGGLFLFRYPAVIVCDPGLIEKVLVQDFVYFTDRYHMDNHPFANSLGGGKGDKWRLMRNKLIPIFTKMKVKGMFEQVLGCGDYVLSKISECAEKDNAVEVEPLMFNYSTEAVASCTFGVHLLSDSAEEKKFKDVIRLLNSSSPMVVVKYFIAMLHPKIISLFGIKLVSQRATEYFITLTKEAISYREKNTIKRDDFLQLVMDLKYNDVDSIKRGGIAGEDKNITISTTLEHKESSEERIFTEDCICSLIFNILESALNPSEVTLSFAFFEIAKTPIIQYKLQQEIESALIKHKRWTFEAVNDMTYLDQVIQETLRLYTFNPGVARVVTEPYRLPGTEVTLDKGMMVYIPVAAIHMDPLLYPSPEVFDPERFVGNNYKPSTSFMPFGNGPRMCISVRYAVMMMKVCLAKVLSQYEVSICSKMQLPLSFDQNEFVPKVKGGIWLTFEDRKQTAVVTDC